MLKSEEFAKQILFLNNTAMERAMPKSTKVGLEFAEVRNVPHPMYISQWLMAVASARSSQIKEAYPLISKKMRDEVIKEIKAKTDQQHEVPFRRSGCYTAMKVFLQLSLTIELGAERGRFVYKLVMLKIMSQLCAKHSVDADVAIQMLAKMARRMDKITNLAESKDELGNALIQLKDLVFVDVAKIIRNERGKLDEKFEAIQTKERRASSLEAMPRLKFEQDIIHQIPELRKYIALRNAKIVTAPIDNYPRPRRIIRHAWENMAFPDISQLNQDSGEIDVSQILVDFEHWILVTSVENYRNFSANQLRQLATAYMTKARAFYTGDCFGYSKMVLAILKIIQVCRSTKSLFVMHRY